MCLCGLEVFVFILAQEQGRRAILVLLHARRRDVGSEKGGSGQNSLSRGLQGYVSIKHRGPGRKACVLLKRM